MAIGDVIFWARQKIQEHLEEDNPGERDATPDVQWLLTRMAELDDYLLDVTGVAELPKFADRFDDSDSG